LEQNEKLYVLAVEVCALPVEITIQNYLAEKSVFKLLHLNVVNIFHEPDEFKYEKVIKIHEFFKIKTYSEAPF
jgi:hypothetical protein